ncbi:MAG: glycolate oxidase [Bacteroidia bacterium]
MNLKTQLSAIIDRDLIYEDDASLLKYGQDQTEDLIFKPDVVVIPKSVQDVSSILKFCNANKIPVSPRGAGTGLSGACLPISGGISLSMEAFDKILKVDVDNLQAVVEPGVINEVFRNEVELLGLFYPPDPASRGSCFLGGNVAHNSGGPKAVKYGVTRDYILNLEVVLPNGEVIWTGSDTLKNSTGYSLTHLMIGSEGTLGVITKIVVKLIAKPKCDVLLWASFSNAIDACKAVSEVMKSGVVPSGLELMERKGIELAAEMLNLPHPMPIDSEASLLIELDGNNMDLLFADAELINGILEDYNVLDVRFGDTSAQKESWWKLRKSIGEIVKAHSIYKEEDTVVKRASLPELMAGVKEIGAEYGFESVCYGHAGDGNLHVNILKNNMSDEAWNGEHLDQGIRKIFQLCKRLGGTISGEHGIGYVQKGFMNEVMKDAHFTLFRGIKAVFDPNGIMNPGKIFD